MISFNLPTIGQVKSHDWYMIMSQNDSTQIAPCWRFSKKHNFWLVWLNPNLSYNSENNEIFADEMGVLIPIRLGKSNSSRSW